MKADGVNYGKLKWLIAYFMRLGAIDVRLAFKWDFHLLRYVFGPEPERTNCEVIAELAIGNVRFRQKCVRICFTFLFERRF